MRQCFNSVLWLGISIIFGAAGCSPEVAALPVAHDQFAERRADKTGRYTASYCTRARCGRKADRIQQPEFGSRNCCR